MKRTPLHPIAVLRRILDMGQKEFADFVGCSTATVQSLEGGPKRLKLTRKRALSISDATKVSVDWLLAGDSEAAPLDQKGRLYTKESKKMIEAETGWKPNLANRREYMIVNFHTTDLLSCIITLLICSHQKKCFTQIRDRVRNQMRQVIEEFFPETIVPHNSVIDITTATFKIGESLTKLRVQEICMAVSALLDRENNHVSGPPLPESWFQLIRQEEQSLKAQYAEEEIKREQARINAEEIQIRAEKLLGPAAARSVSPEFVISASDGPKDSAKE